MIAPNDLKNIIRSGLGRTGLSSVGKRQAQVGAPPIAFASQADTASARCCWPQRASGMRARGLCFSGAEFVVAHNSYKTAELAGITDGHYLNDATSSGRL